MTEKNEAFDISKIPSSKETYNDPSFYEVARWHVSKCDVCREGENKPPPAFGVLDPRHCREYYEIAQEYSDYERDYIRWGNP